MISGVGARPGGRARRGPWVAPAVVLVGVLIGLLALLPTFASAAPATSVGIVPIPGAIGGETTAATGATSTTTAGPLSAKPAPMAGSTDPNGVTVAEQPNVPPSGHRLTADQAQRIARADPKAARVLRENRGSYDRIFLKGQTRWQLSIYAEGKPLRELGQVLIDDATGKVTESWDGPYVAWTMARGYDGAFGRSITNPWLWAGLLVLFVLPFVRMRPFRVPPLALLLLAGFSAPLAFFNNARLDWAVPLSFGLLLGLFLWATWRGVRRPRQDPAEVRLSVPVTALVLLGLGLLAFRIVLNVTDGNVIDVGYASVVGASRIGEGHSLYGAFPSDVGRGDTYGPLTYLAYLPFEQLWPWGGRWDDLPAAHAAAIGFDVLTTGLLYLVGRRQERDPAAGQRRGILYAYLWLACPWTAYALNSNANDALVAVAMALLLLIGTRPFLRGASAAAAGAAKIAPFAVLPVLATRRRVAPTVAVEHGRASWRPGALLAFSLGVLLVVGVTAVVVLHGQPVRLLWDRTVGYQAGRDAPFMPWGYYDLPLGRTLARAASIVFAIALAFVPRRHDLTGTAALVLAVVLGLQLATEYWFYLYLTWLVPLIVVAAIGDRALRWPLPRRVARPAVTPRVLGPLPEEDAPWAAQARQAAESR